MQPLIPAAVVTLIIDQFNRGQLQPLLKNILTSSFKTVLMGEKINRLLPLRPAIERGNDLFPLQNPDEPRKK